MSDPAIARLEKMIEALTATVNTSATSITNMQQQIQTLQQQHPAASSESRGPGYGALPVDRPPRFQKLDFPRFDGKSDPLAFLNRCESYFRQQRIAAEEQVWMASYNLEAGAQMWYLQVQQSEGTPSWRRFSELLNMRYGPPLRSNPLGELMACKQQSSVAEYQDRFEALLPRAGPLEEEQRIQAFTAGLRPPLNHDVEMHNPQTLVVAMSLARKLELRKQSVVAAASTPAAPRLAGRGLLPGPSQPLALPAPPPRNAPAPPLPVGRPIRRLSQAEMEDRRQKGLCFNCEEIWPRP
jgi:hypothetical protein